MSTLYSTSRKYIPINQVALVIKRKETTVNKLEEIKKKSNIPSEDRCCKQKLVSHVSEEYLETWLTVRNSTKT